MKKEVFNKKGKMTWYERDRNKCIRFRQNSEDLCQAVAAYCVKNNKRVDDITASEFHSSIQIEMVSALLSRCQGKLEMKRVFQKFLKNTIHGQFRWVQTKQPEVKPSMKGIYAWGQMARNRIHDIISQAV